MSDEPNSLACDDPINGDSHVWNISIRAWLAIIVVITICAMSALSITVVEPLYTIGSLTVGFYFGQKTNKGTT